jgi:hypothetical protein
MILTDRLFLDDAAKVRITSDGYLVASPRVARPGIQLYKGFEVERPEMDTVRVFRPEAEVFHKDSLSSYAHRPITVDHPPVMVNAGNWRKYAVGALGDEVLRDGEAIRIPLIVMDVAAIKGIQEGKQELSLGYATDLKWEAGITPQGDAYDAVQTNIRANHLAIVDAARGGPQLRIGDRQMEPILQTILVDGVNVQVTDVSAGVINRALTAMQGQITKLQKDLETEKEEKEKVGKAKDEAVALVATKDAEITTLKKALEDASDPVRLEAAAKDRSAVVDKAKVILGDSFKADGKSVTDIRKEVISTKLGDAAKGWTPEQIEASFNTMTASLGDKFADAMSTRTRAPSNSMEARDVAYQESIAHMQNAWKGEPAKA